MTNPSIFTEGENCLPQTRARHAAPIVDCGPYYKALHYSISQARKRIIIVGWDIDSRIRLLRGEDEEQSELPSVISDLIRDCAEANPDLEVFLLRWDSSLAFFNMREVWAKEVWDEKTPDNVHTVLDDTIPMGGSQHQKIVIIDDELAYCGGMDVAVHRWDTREHKIDQPERDDGDGSYGPFHDIQVVVTGEIVDKLSELVRWRWNRLENHYENLPQIGEAAPRSNKKRDDLPTSWPSFIEPVFHDMECAISRTIPFMDNAEPVQEVRRMLLDLIDQAEDFIYIENQFASRGEIAEALNKRMREQPKLKVLLVSSYKPKSTVECEAYWAGRIDFKKILQAKIEENRVLMAYSTATNADGLKGHKRVHAKFMTIDDKYMVVGSSNLSNRSMTLDTECDVIFRATNDKHRKGIAHISNDLISEHSGWDESEVAEFINSDKPFEQLTRCKQEYAWCLREAEDELFTDQSLQNLVSPFTDPEEPIVPSIPLFNGKRLHIPNPSKKTLVISAFIACIALLVGGGYYLSEHVSWMNSENLENTLNSLRGTGWTLPAVILIYIIAGIFFFPVTVLSLAVAAVYGPVWGPIYGMFGVMSSTTVLFLIGHFLGDGGLRKLAGPRVEKIDKKFAERGIVGVAALRMIPIAPFSLVNLVGGISRIRFYQFFIGTFLGMFPPMIAKGLVGDSLAKVFTNPTVTSIGYLVGGILVWIAVVYASQKLANYYQRRKQSLAQQC